MVDKASSVVEDRGLGRRQSPLWGLELRALGLALELGAGHLWIVQPLLL